MKNIKVIYSRVIERPEEQSCERMVEDPTVIVIKEKNDRKFEVDYIYFKFQSLS